MAEALECFVLFFKLIQHQITASLNSSVEVSIELCNLSFSFPLLVLISKYTL